mgnify:CR=1 FL=1
MATAPLVIYAYPHNPRVLKTLVAANYNEVEIKLPEIQMGVTNKSPEFLAKFPLGKVPAMDTPYGPLCESNAIFRYGGLKRVQFSSFVGFCSAFTCCYTVSVLSFRVSSCGDLSSL